MPEANPMDKQVFMIGILCVYHPVGHFISVSCPLQSRQVLRIFAFDIFCELKVPAPWRTVLATQISVKDIGYLILPSIKRSLAADIVRSLHV